MKTQFCTLLLFLSTAMACGTSRPKPSAYRVERSQTSAVSSEVETQKNDARNQSANNKPTMTSASKDDEAEDIDTTPTPAPLPPAAAKAPLRTLANATEIASSKSAYAIDCAGCHQALANSAKKSSTLVRINASGVAGKVAAHNALINANKWPIDILDTSDDGIDNAMLKASAMVEALR